jgi:hypothetical protein
MLAQLLELRGVGIAVGERRQHIDFRPQGATLTVYGQTELTRDLVEAREAAGSPPVFGVDGVVIDGATGERPQVRYRLEGAEHRRERSDELLDVYSATALRRIWRAERFSAWLTSVLHRFPGRTSFDRGMQLAELDNLATSAAARAAFVEAYTGFDP